MFAAYKNLDYKSFDHVGSPKMSLQLHQIPGRSSQIGQKEFSITVNAKKSPSNNKNSPQHYEMGRTLYIDDINESFSKPAKTPTSLVHGDQTHNSLMDQ